ncbi:MAG TPA: UPF0158 family protein [Ignavibacteriales bacterium]|nr:UPF0158 family protein [Ignavibacteriales bacterium]
MKTQIEISYLTDTLINHSEQPLYLNLKTYHIVKGKSNEFLSHPEHYITLPDRTDLNENLIFEKFLRYLDETTENIIRNEIKLNGNKKNIPSILKKYNVLEDWEEFRKLEYKTILVNWCKNNKINFII